MLLTAGTGESGPWVRTVDADGTVREVLTGADVGGEPVGAVVLPDGRWARLLVAGAGDETRATWRVVEVDLVDGTRRETGVAGSRARRAGRPQGRCCPTTAAPPCWSTRRAGPPRSPSWTPVGRSPLEAPTDDPATYFEFRALPSGAALLGSDGTVTLYDADGRIRQQFDALPGAVIDLDVAPDGTWGVTVGAEGAIELWDIDAATGRWSEKEVLSGAGGIVGTAMIDPSGDRMYSLSSDGMLIVWDVSPDRRFRCAPPGAGRPVDHRRAGRGGAGGARRRPDPPVRERRPG